MATIITLVPCPFCKNDDILEFVDLGFVGATYYCVTCQNCGSRGPNGATYQAAADAWNLSDPCIG